MLATDATNAQKYKKNQFFLLKILNGIVKEKVPPIHDKLSVDLYRFLGVRVYLRGGMFAQVVLSGQSGKDLA